MGIEVEVLRLAERQYGVIADRQVRELGGDRHLIIRRVRLGRWERVTSRVVRVVGSPETAEQRLMIAVLHAGPSGLASHESAAWLWNLPGFAATDIVLRGRAHGAGLDEGHRPKLVLPDHRTAVRGIACTTLPRTIFDLAAILRPGRTKALVNTVVTRSPAMLPALHRTLPELARRGRTGITVMREILAANPVGTAVPASGNEARFEEICHNAGIHGLERQVDVGGHSWLGRVDFLLRRLGLVIEIDSELHHSSPGDVARDEARDAAMLAAGFRKVLRIKAEDLWRAPHLVVATVRAAIAELESTVA
jgi:very-short-patch-repair endonuclease